MAASTTKFKARRALIDHFRDADGLSGVKIDYSFVDTMPPESISLGSEITDDETNVQVTRPHPSVYVEKYLLVVEVFVGSKNSLGANEKRCGELVEAIYRALREDPRIGERVPGLIAACIVRSDVTTGHVKDEGAMTRTDLYVEVEARIAD